MPRYDKIWSALASRAVRQGGVDAQTFLQMSVDAGMAPQEVMDRLEVDLVEGGPIFGKFARSLKGAASQSVLAAERGGQLIGTTLAETDQGALNSLLKLSSVQGSVYRQGAEQAVREADPEFIERLEKSLGPQNYMWVATLERTCHRCLPLHSQVNTLSGWQALGFLPETIHSGWSSSCHCQLIPQSEAESRKEALAPLVRRTVKSPTGIKASKKTARAVTNADLTKAIKARDKAMESEKGRQTLRLLGQTDLLEFKKDRG